MPYKTFPPHLTNTTENPFPEIARKSRHQLLSSLSFRRQQQRDGYQARAKKTRQGPFGCDTR